MAALNKVILIGHLTANPELKNTPGGVSVTSFAIGVTRRYTKQGEQPTTDFINIVAWRTTAEFICKYFKKGSVICICGSIQTRSYMQNGEKRYATEVVADEATFVEKKASEAGASRGASSSPTMTENFPAEFSDVTDDEELPF